MTSMRIKASLTGAKAEMSGKAYSVISAVYDRLTDQTLYEKWKDRSLEVLSAYPHLRCGLDVACGSGFFTIAQKKAGYNVIGVDFSEEMLVKARANSDREKLNIPFLLQDMSALKVLDKVDYITVINDGISYLDDRSLVRAFKSFYTALKKGGVLYFDFSTEYRLKNVIGNNVFAEDYDDLTFLWFNELKEGSVKMDITVFLKNGDKYDRYDETQIQYFRPLSMVQNALENVGFKKISACSFFGGDIQGNTERIEIIAEK